MIQVNIKIYWTFLTRNQTHDHELLMQYSANWAIEHISLSKLFIKTITALPASTAWECLYSTSGLLFTPRRAQPNCNNFLNQHLFKLSTNFPHSANKFMLQWFSMKMRSSPWLFTCNSFQNDKSHVFLCVFLQLLWYNSNSKKCYKNKVDLTLCTYTMY